jgi:glycerophosphoryl diester phosphodiesterase
MQRLAPDLMVSAPADTVNELAFISSVRVDFTRILAWTGTKEPNSALNIEMAEKGVEVMFGTLGDASTSWDARFAREGDQGYTAFADTGIHVIATDRPLEAMRAIDDADGPGAPASACLTAK